MITNRALLSALIASNLNHCCFLFHSTFSSTTRKQFRSRLSPFVLFSCVFLFSCTFPSTASHAALPHVCLCAFVFPFSFTLLYISCVLDAALQLLFRSYVCSYSHTSCYTAQSRIARDQRITRTVPYINRGPSLSRPGVTSSPRCYSNHRPTHPCTVV